MNWGRAANSGHPQIQFMGVPNLLSFREGRIEYIMPERDMIAA